MSEGSVKAREIRYRKRNGDITWCSITASCHFNSMGKPDWIEGLVEDINEKKMAHDAVEANLKLLQTLIDTINSPIFYKNTDGVYLGCNYAFANLLLGLPKDKIIGKTLSEIGGDIPLEVIQDFDKKDRELFENPGSQIYERILKCTDNQAHTFQFNKSAFPEWTALWREL